MLHGCWIPFVSSTPFKTFALLLVCIKIVTPATFPPSSIQIPQGDGGEIPTLGLLYSKQRAFPDSLLLLLNLICISD